MTDLAASHGPGVSMRTPQGQEAAGRTALARASDVRFGVFVPQNCNLCLLAGPSAPLAAAFSPWLAAPWLALWGEQDHPVCRWLPPSKGGTHGRQIPKVETAR